MSDKRIQFMNTYIDNITKDQVLLHIVNCIRTRESEYVLTINTDQVVRIDREAGFDEIYKKAGLLVCDGTPLLWISKYYKTPIKEKIVGSELLYDICKMAANEGFSVFLFGAAEGVAKTASEKLIALYPKLKIAGTYSPPINFEKNPAELKKAINLLKQSESDILIVAMSVPRQEYFIGTYYREFNIPISIALGASIDFVAGEQKWCPRWINRIGLEWAYRMLHDPKRLVKRYLVDDVAILSMVWKYRKKNNH